MTLIADLTLDDLSATQRLALRLAPLLAPGDVLALHGPLGSGKTSFSRALIQALGLDEDVPSPTFTLVQVYEPIMPAMPAIWHFDLYRLERPEDAYELGVDDAFETAISLIEWPERLGAALPGTALHLYFDFVDDPAAETRKLRLDGDPAWAARLAKILPL